jgi:hypothetical protein
MTTTSTLGGCTSCACAAGTLERVRYYPRQLLTADDMSAEQQYLLQKVRNHNRYLHGWGVVCGMEVVASPTEASPWRVRVCPGYVVTPQGCDIRVNEPADLDLATGSQTGTDPCADAWPCPPTGTMPGGKDDKVVRVYVAIRHAECRSRPERVLPAGCGCDETACEHSRIRDSFELMTLWELPASHRLASQADATWVKAFRVWQNQSAEDRTQPEPVPACPSCPEDPWVVLARVELPKKNVPLPDGSITYHGRRVLYSVSAIQVILTSE